MFHKRTTKQKRKKQGEDNNHICGYRGLVLVVAEIRLHKFGKFQQLTATTTTTKNKTDLVPTTRQGQIIGVFTMCDGVAFLALPVVVLSSTFVDTPNSLQNWKKGNENSQT